METKGYRAVIRQFLRGVEWASPRNISILIHNHLSKLEICLTKHPKGRMHCLTKE